MDPVERRAQIERTRAKRISRAPFHEGRQIRAALGERDIGQITIGMVSAFLDSLTPREKDILRLIAEGLSNKMIGRKLDISDGTVKVHVKHLLKKLNLRSRVEVAVWAVEEGLHKG